jgi:hypothetical protein
MAYSTIERTRNGTGSQEVGSIRTGRIVAQEVGSIRTGRIVAARNEAYVVEWS